jgi:hypothetical protein
MKSTRMLQPTVLSSTSTGLWKTFADKNWSSKDEVYSETDFYHSQISPLLHLLRLMGALPIEIRK